MIEGRLRTKQSEIKPCVDAGNGRCSQGAGADGRVMDRCDIHYRKYKRETRTDKCKKRGCNERAQIVGRCREHGNEHMRRNKKKKTKHVYQHGTLLEKFFMWTDKEQTELLPYEWSDAWLRGIRTPCWPWKGYTAGGNPRGQIKHNNQNSMAYHVAYEHYIGPIEDGMTYDHLCSRPECVNPWHGEIVTHKENHQRGIAAKARRKVWEEERGIVRKYKPRAKSTKPRKKRSDAGLPRVARKS